MLYLGDCLEIMPTLPAASVDLILCDLPYGTTQCPWDAVIPFAPLWAQYWRIAKPSAAVVLTASQPFTSALVMSNPLKFRHEWIYKKRCASNFAQAAIAPMKEHESVLVFGNARVLYNPTKHPRVGGGSARIKYGFGKSSGGDFVSKTLDDGANPHQEDLRFPSSVQEFNNRASGDRGLHPTQKPVALMEYLIRTYTNEDDTVLDNCMGSGTTGVACKNTGRKFIGIERDPAYFEIARKRTELMPWEV